MMWKWIFMIAAIAFLLYSTKLSAQLPQPPIIDSAFIQLRLAALDLELLASQQEVAGLKQYIAGLQAENAQLKEKLKKYEPPKDAPSD